MRNLMLGAACALKLIAGTAKAETVESMAVAPNDVAVAVSTDEAAAQQEYSSPAVDLGTADHKGFVIATRLRHDGKLDELMLMSALFYVGDWRHYDGATFDDGAPARFEHGAQKVVTCSPQPCTRSEEVGVRLSPSEVSAHGRDGELRIQVRAATATTMLHIPLSYIQAVNDVAEGAPGTVSMRRCEAGCR